MGPVRLKAESVHDRAAFGNEDLFDCRLAKE
jgi:hypothetical protein